VTERLHVRRQANRLFPASEQPLCSTTAAMALAKDGDPAFQRGWEMKTKSTRQQHEHGRWRQSQHLNSARDEALYEDTMSQSALGSKHQQRSGSSRHV